MADRAAGAVRATQFEPGIIARASGALRLLITGKAPDFFGPGEPLAPVAQEAAQGRQFDYPTAVNIQARPRHTEVITFEQLRALADGYDLLRLLIETRKDQMAKLVWTIKKRDGAEGTPEAKKMLDLLRYPDREHDFTTWMRMLHEEMLVIDAPCIYRRTTKGGSTYALELMDGATIKRNLDESGRTPVAPDPAYQQVIKGLPAVNYSTDELLYMPRNPRVSRVYGYSPVEQIIMTVNIALRRQVHQLAYYTEGNIPSMLAAVPTTWSTKQIEEFQKYWDLVMSGDLAKLRKIKFVPGDLKTQATQTEKLFDEGDEWLARVCCFAFSMSPQPFAKQMNRATAENAQEAALEEGLAPLMQWQKSLMDRIIGQWFGATDHEFSWQDESDIDPLVQAQIDQIYIGAGVDTPNEIRDRRGMEPIEGGDEPRQPMAPVAAPDDEGEGTPPKPGKAKSDAVKKRRSLRLGY